MGAPSPAPPPPCEASPAPSPRACALQTRAGGDGGGGGSGGCSPTPGRAGAVPRRRTEELDLVVAHGQLLLPDDPRRVRLGTQQRRLRRPQRRACLAVRHLGSAHAAETSTPDGRAPQPPQRVRALASSRSTERSWFFRLAFFTFFLAKATAAPLRDAVAPGVASGARIVEGRGDSKFRWSDDITELLLLPFEQPHF